MDRFSGTCKRASLLALAVGILAFMHFYRLTQVPYGLNVDEAGAAYDAYCISNFGVDRWLMRYPVYFMNYGDGQNALNTYLIAVLFKICGGGTARILVRLPIATASLLAGLFGWLFMRDREHEYADCVWLILYAIMPVFIMTQRFGLESHLLLCASAAIFYFTSRAVETGSRKWYFLFGGVTGVALYTYALTYIVIPVYLLFLFFYLCILKKWSWRNVALLVVPLGILAFPLILVQMVNLFRLPTMSLGPLTIPHLNKYRSNELTVGFATALSNLKNLLHSTLLYDDLQYNTLAKFGTLYYVSLPFLGIGFVRAVAETVNSFRKKIYSRSALVVFWTAAEIIMGLFLTGNSFPNSTRMIGIFIPLLYFVVLGLRQVWLWLGKLGCKWNYVYIAAISLAYGCYFISFARYYFTDYNSEVFPLKWLFYEPYEEVREFLSENAEEDWSSMSVAYPWNYIYFLYSYQMDPYEVNLPLRGILNYQGNIINEYAGVEDMRLNYVTLKPPGNPSLDIVLASRGYTRYDLGGNFYFNLSPFAYWVVEKNSEEALVFLDTVKMEEEEGEYCLRGWCVDRETDRPYSGLRLETDGVVCWPVESWERRDVAAAYEKEEYAMSGYEVFVPAEEFQRSEKVRLVGVTDSGKEVTLITWRKTEEVYVRGAEPWEVTETFEDMF